jgi:hypothetical protein
MRNNMAAPGKYRQAGRGHRLLQLDLERLKVSDHPARHRSIANLEKRLARSRPTRDVIAEVAR